MRRIKNKAHLAIIRAIIAGPDACATPESLAKGLGTRLDAVQDSLATLDVEGWVAAWEREDGVLVTLTSLAAELCRVHLVESGRFGAMRWRPVDEPVASPRGHSAMGGDADVDFFDQRPDPAPPPDIAAELAESRIKFDLDDAGEPRKLDPGELPRPTILLGLDMSPFPGPSSAARARGRCPVCRSEDGASNVLHPRAYCLWCDRWGLDALVAQSAAAYAARARTRAQRRDDPSLAEAQRRVRKARRRDRHKQVWSAKAKPGPSGRGRKDGLGFRPGSVDNVARPG